MRRFRRYSKPDKLLIYSAEVTPSRGAPSSPPPAEKKFPPVKHRVDLKTLLNSPWCTNNNHHANPSDCYEDANYFYFLDYSTSGPCLTFAMNKNLYSVSASYFDLSTIDFDARFIFGQDIPGSLQFGKYRTDKDLGRLFYLTEPKDATHMLLSLSELGGTLEWLQNATGVCYFHHSANFQLYVVLHVGTRFVKDQDPSDRPSAIVYYNKSLEDRTLYQNLFNEQLRHFIDPTVKLTQFHVETPPPTEEELAEAQRKKEAEAERLKKIWKNIDVAATLLSEQISVQLKEFNLIYHLKLDREFRKVCSYEVVKLTLAEAGNNNDVACTFTVDSDSFLRLTPEVIANSLCQKVTHFLDEYREAFHIYQNFYRTNQAYRDLINPDSLAPKLDYPHIFETDRLL